MRNDKSIKQSILFKKKNTKVELDSMTIHETEIIIFLLFHLTTIFYEWNLDKTVDWCYVDTFLKGKLPPMDKLGGKLHVSIDLNVLVSLGFADV